ncbi:MAG: MipA/OmpV family protein [Hylemonella sp.]|nr:MipA/OmpV family protein [Hylemonella sp.]
MRLSFITANSPRFCLALALSLAALVPSVQAQSFEAVRLAPGQEGGRIGLVAIAGTQYRGSDERRTLVVPGIDYQWRNGWFAGVGNGVGYNAARRPDLQYGARLTLDLGRAESRSEVLRGMGDIPIQGELGLFFNRLWGPRLALTSSLRHGSGTQRQGLVLDLGASYGVPLGAQTRLSLGMGAHWANAEHLQDFFGVTPAQSARTGYAVSSPGAGWRNVNLNLGLSHRLDARTSLIGGLSRSALQGAARDSVLTRESATTSAVLALSYAY